MDSTTVITLLAAQLICAAALFALIGRALPAEKWLIDWSLAGLAFGAAFAARLAGGLHLADSSLPLADVLLVAGALLILRGLRRFLGIAGRRNFVLLGLLAFAVAHGIVVVTMDGQGRFLFLNTVLSLIYGIWSWTTLRGLKAVPAGSRQRLPLAVAASAFGLFSVWTAVRVGMTLLQGTSMLYVGMASALHFGVNSLLLMFLGYVLLWLVFERISEQLAHLASHDSLTSVLNRIGLKNALIAYFGVATRGMAAPRMVLLLIDIDHFKRVNDELGHATGDAVLRAVAATIREACRGEDFVARTGGEEFLVGCAGEDVDFASRMAERIRERVAGLVVQATAARQVTCTVSVGVSHPFSRLEDWEAASIQADRALYLAKTSGRNRSERLGVPP
jgi:diguanylate cyclase (GGDEF)-like protein